MDAYSDDDSVKIHRDPIAYRHDVVFYVPVFQKNFDDDGNVLMFSTFEYSLSNATQDHQMAASMEPDYILELRGNFNARIKPFKVGGDSENSSR
jgi:hypothetical protein